MVINGVSKSATMRLNGVFKSAMMRFVKVKFTRPNDALTELT